MSYSIGTSSSHPEADRIDRKVEAYVSHMKCWEATAPCYWFVPVLGCSIDICNELALHAKYDNIFRDMKDLKDRGALNPLESSLFTALQSSKMTDPHLGRVKDEGLPGLYQIQNITRSLRGGYISVLNELEADINEYRSKVNTWSCYAPMCFFFIPIIGCYFDGCMEDKIHRLYYKIWYTTQGLHKRGLLGDEFGPRFERLGLMKDPHWGRVKSEGLDHINEISSFIEGLKRIWERQVRNIATTRSTRPASSAPVLPSLKMKKPQLGSLPVIAAAQIIDQPNDLKTGVWWQNNIRGKTEDMLQSKLQDLLESKKRGLITEKEYADAKKTLLDNFTK